MMKDNEIFYLFTKAVDIFVSRIKKDPNHRYVSWEHCYSQFLVARKTRNLKSFNIDNLSLHLAFYLASWGMYRGSSFLLQKDYKIHKEIVEELLRSDYDVLSDIWWIFPDSPEIEEVYNTLRQLVTNLKSIYYKFRIRS